MDTPPPPIDDSLLDPHKRSLRPRPASAPPPATSEEKPSSQPGSRPVHPAPSSSPKSTQPLAKKTAQQKREAVSSPPAAVSATKPATKPASTEPVSPQPTPPGKSKPPPRETANGKTDDVSSKQPERSKPNSPWGIIATIVAAIFTIICIVATKNDEIARLERRVSQLNEIAAKQQRGEAALTKKANNRADRIGQLETTVAENERKISQKDLEIARLEREKQNLQSRIVDLESKNSDALRRVASAESELASEMSRATEASNRARKAERQLAAARKSSSDTATKPSESSKPGKGSDSKDAWVVVSATVDGKPVKNARLYIDGGSVSLPKKFKVKYGSKTKKGTVRLFKSETNHEYREGTLQPLTVDWTGEKKVSVSLNVPLPQSWDDDEFDLDRELRSSWGDDDPWTFQP